MREFILLLTSLFILSGCSFVAPPNQSQFKSSTAFTSYTKNFLSDRDALAKNDLKRAIEHAKRGANFNALARIYLGECALNISVGLNTRCEKYTNIQELTQTDSLNSYYLLITQELQQDNISLLPTAYQEFASSLVKKDFNKAYSEILDMDSTSSQLISASLIKESLNEEKINKIIQIASFNGYKKSTVFWLEELRKLTDDRETKDKISKKINILKARK